jgi:hypothetical protein
MEHGAMTAAGPLEFAAFVNDIVYTIIFIFGKPPPNPGDLIEWLRPMCEDEDRRATLMHEEPLYIAADFVGIDRLSPAFRPYEDKYLQFRAGFLYPLRAPIATP